MSSPSQSVLALPELLSQILGFLDNRNHASTALVCKAWSEESLNLLWEYVGFRELLKLLRLLAPLVEQADGSDDLLKFQRRLHTQDWAAVDKYAKRVRYLDCSPEFMDWVDPSLWLEIGSTRPRSIIFPNLRHLSCAPQPSVISVLAPDDLEHLMLIGSGFHSTPITIQNTILHVQSRMKSLRSFALTGDDPEPQELQPILPQLLRGFWYIRSLTVPQSYLTSAVTHVLASFPNLKRLTGRPEDDPAFQTQMFPPSLKEGSFPSLESLYMNAPFSGLIPCLPRMTNLVHLEIMSFEFDLPHECAQIIRAVASTLSNLEGLTLSPSDTSEPSDAHDHITFSVLRPVLSLQKLKHLDIRHCHPLDLSCDDVISFLQRLPQLTDLSLNPCPALCCDLILNGTDLLKIASYGQRLEGLGLYLDLRTLPIYDKVVPMPSLGMFCYGESHIPYGGAESVVTFLNHILPNGCTLFKDSWHGNSGFRDADWEEVERLRRG